MAICETILTSRSRSDDPFASSQFATCILDRQIADYAPEDYGTGFFLRSVTPPRWGWVGGSGRPPLVLDTPRPPLGGSRPDPPGLKKKPAMVNQRAAAGYSAATHHFLQFRCFLQPKEGIFIIFRFVFFSLAPSSPTNFMGFIVE